MQNIKSVFIIKKIFEHLKTRKKLYIVKYSNKYLDKLNLGKKDFENLVSLKNLENKFHLDLDIADVNIKILDLSKAILVNKQISDFMKKAFPEELRLFYKKINYVSYIDTILETLNLDKLEVLDLEENYITELNFLEKIRSKNLRILNVAHNFLSNIKILTNVNFKNLEKLYLYKNKISDISALINFEFENLNTLNLGENKISDINVLTDVSFSKLEILNLKYNNISDIDVFKKVNFKELKELYLQKNNISKINVLSKVRFPKLEILNLKKNKINTKENAEENAPVILHLKSSIKKFWYKHNSK